MDTRVSIHLRDTTSTIAKQTRRQHVKCVASQIQIRFGAHTSQSGHGRFSLRERGCNSGSVSPWAISTRRNVAGDTHTKPW